MEDPPSPPQVTLHSYGTIHCGYETMSAAWPNMEHVFSIGGTSSSMAAKVAAGSRPSKDLLVQSPVDMLVVDMGHAQSGTSLPDTHLLGMIERAQSRPLVVVESL